MTDDPLKVSFKHEKLRDLIKQGILKGEFKAGERLPSQNEFCKRFGVSSNTVREAIASLVQEGLLYRVQGSGTYLTDSRRRYLTFGLMLPHLHVNSTEPEVGYDSGFLLKIACCIEREAKICGANVILRLDTMDADEDDSVLVDREMANLQDLLAQKVDGIIMLQLVGEESRPCVDELKRAGVPFVLIDRYPDGIELDYVVSNNYKGAYDATRILLDKGFNRIYHFTSTLDVRTLNDRLRGYRDAMEGRGLSCEDMLVRIPIDLRVRRYEEQAYRAACELFDGIDLPIAIFAADQPNFVGVLRALEEKKVDLNRVALACYDDPVIRLPEGIFLVKVVQPLEEIGARSVRALMDRLTGYKDPQHICLDSSIQVLSGEAGSPREWRVISGRPFDGGIA